MAFRGHRPLDLERPLHSDSTYSMNIQIEFLAQLGVVAGGRLRVVEVPASCSAQDAIRAALADEAEDLRSLVLDGEGDLQPSLLVFVGDEQLDWSQPTALQPDDTIVLAPPIAGG